MPPIFTGRSETSYDSIRRMPDSPASSRDQVCSTPLARGVTMPSPVTTTRLIVAASFLTSSLPPT